MAVIETWLRQDLKGLVSVRSLQGQVFSLDNGGNLIGVKVTKDGQPVTLTGTVTGYCILSDGQTVTVTGSGKSGIQNGNEAYIVLPQLVYSVPGQISIVIKLTSGSVTTTLAACTGYVYRSRTSNEVVPSGTPIPDLATMEEVIRRATAATDAANTAATGAEKVDASMTKEGDIITISVTDRDGNVTEETVTDQTEAMKRKADIDGYYEELAVGTADQLVSTEAVTDTTPYLYRKSGGSVDIGNRATLEKIIGGTVAWNQFVRNGNFSTDTNWQRSSNSTISISNGELRIQVTQKYGGATQGLPIGHFAKDHVYLILASIKAASNRVVQIGFGDNVNFTYGADKTVTTSYTIVGYVRRITDNVSTASNSVFVRDANTSDFVDIYVNKFNMFDLTAMFGPTIADYIYNLEQTTPGAGVAWFRRLFPKDYYSYNPGELISVKTTNHDMIGFNLWDGTGTDGKYVKYDTGELINWTGNVFRATDYIKVLPNTAYYFNQHGIGSAVVGLVWYDENKNYISGVKFDFAGIVGEKTSPSNARYVRTSVQLSEKESVCINLSHSGSRNGEYEPYEKHSYPLADVELRGIVGIDENGGLVYDGDEYTSDGNVARKYGLVNLGTLTWNQSELSGYFYATISNMKQPSNETERLTGIRTAVYPISSTYALDQNSPVDKTMLRYTNWIVIRDSSYATAAAFKAAMDGVYLLYELATPETEEVAPYTPVQVVDDWGTEEFVDNREVAIPVGHSTSYMANLRDKLQHLPSLAEEDGEYIVKQTGTKMELAKLSSSGLAQGIFVETESSPVVSFSDGANSQAMKAVNVAIEPVQDLHGYDAPWPAGGRVNKFACGDAVGIAPSVGATYGLTVVCDGETETVTVSGTPTWTSAGSRIFRLVSTRSGSYYGDAPVTHDYSGMAGKWFVISTSSNVTNISSEALINTDGTIGITLNNTDAADVSIVLKLCIYEGSTAPTEWTPYSNICPISGFDSVKVTRCRKNLFNYNATWYNGYYMYGKPTGTFEELPLSRCTGWQSYKVPVVPGESVTISGTQAQGGVDCAFIGAGGYDDVVSYFGSARMNGTFVVPSGARYLMLVMYNMASKYADFPNAQVEYGSTATDYEPYQGQTYEVAFPTETGTVYGGTLDVVSGKLVVDMAKVDLKQVDFVAMDRPANVGGGKCFLGSVITPLAIYPTSEGRQKYSSGQVGDAYYASGNRCNAYQTNNRTYFRCGFADSNYLTTIEAFNDWKQQQSAFEIAYVLASPIEYTLTPQEIKTILGANNIWSDAGNVAITYPADTKLYIDRKITEAVANALNA